MLVTCTSCSSNWPTGTVPKLGGLLAVNAEVAAPADGATATAGTRPTTNTATQLDRRRSHRPPLLDIPALGDVDPSAVVTPFPSPSSRGHDAPVAVSPAGESVRPRGPVRPGTFNLLHLHVRSWLPGDSVLDRDRLGARLSGQGKLSAQMTGVNPPNIYETLVSRDYVANGRWHRSQSSPDGSARPGVI